MRDTADMECDLDCPVHQIRRRTQVPIPRQPDSVQNASRRIVCHIFVNW